MPDPSVPDPGVLEPSVLDGSAVALAAVLRAGEVSAREVLAETVARIEQRNPELNAIVTLSLDRATDMAAAADAAWARGEVLGPLHGLPVAHKDLALAAGVRTTFGSPLFADHVPTRSQLNVSRQHAAGAVMVGKTNTPEWGAGSHTFNTVFGITRNPHDLGRTAGGSSGGAAVALAAGMVAVADGSDLGGSLRNPAAFCGVVGLRPSPGRVPAWPDSDPWATMAVEGPMGRTVDDVALLLSVIAGPDERCAVSLDDAGQAFAPPIVARSLSGLRVAWSPRLGDLPVESEVLTVLERAVGRIEAAGAVVTIEDPPLGPAADEVFETLRAVPMAGRMAQMIERHPDKVKSTIHWNVTEGLRRTGADIADAKRETGPDLPCDARLLGTFRRACLPGHAGHALRGRDRISDGCRGAVDGELYRMDASLFADHRHRQPCHLGSGRPVEQRPSRWSATGHSPQKRPDPARDRPSLRSPVVTSGARPGRPRPGEPKSPKPVAHSRFCSIELPTSSIDNGFPQHRIHGVGALDSFEGHGPTFTEHDVGP